MAPLAPNNVMVIGLGGTGKWVLTYLKQSLIHAANHAIATSSPQKNLTAGFGETVPEGIRLLCLDAETGAVDIDGESLDYDEVNGNEFICFRHASDEIQRVQQDLIQESRTTGLSNSHPMFPWFESDDAQMLSLPAVDHGAGAQRQFSRLCFLKSESTGQTFQKKITETIAYFNTLLMAGAPRRTYFIVVGSLAGGTGSGMFQDVIVFLNNCIQITPGITRPVVIGISVLSNAFKGTIRSGIPEALMKSNCIGAIRELQRFVVLRNQPYPDSEYASFAIQPSAGLPCDAVYVIDGTRSASGTDLTTKEIRLSLYPAVADYLQTLCLNSDIPFDPTNTQTFLTATEENLFSTLGSHTWLYPVEDIINSFSVRLAKKYAGYLLEPAASNYRVLDEVADLFENSEKYYCQNTPDTEYFRGVTPNSNKFAFLNRLQSLILDYSQSPSGPPMDLYWFKDFFLPEQFPKRYVCPQVDCDLVSGCELPALDAINECDEFKNLDLLKGLSDPKQVIDLAKKSRIENLGTTNDPTYDPTLPGVRRTWHSIMKYYEKLSVEFFGGYQDAQGTYRPGILENKIFQLLNEIQRQEELKDVQGRPVKGKEAGNQLYDVSYRVRPQSLERAIAFCLTLQSQLTKAKKIIEDTYDGTYKSNGEFQYDADSKETARRESEYLSAGLTKILKRGPFLESIQRWTESERIAIMKRSTTSIIDDFIAVTRGWQETLEKCRDAFGKKLVPDLTIKQNAISSIRQGHATIATRTYLVPENSPQENELYTLTLDTQTGTEVAHHGQQHVIVTNTTSFINSSYLEIFPNSTDVDSRPSVRRTGRDVRPLFKVAGMVTEAFRTEDIVRNAAYWCQGIRQNNFWETLLKDPRYPQGAGGYPNQLATELRNNAADFIQFDTAYLHNTLTMDGRPIQATTTEHAMYADMQQTACNIEAMKTAVIGTATRGGMANMLLGQQFRFTAIRQSHGLKLAALPGYGANQYGTYRSWLGHVSSSSACVGTPVHLHLGEKYAARYEQMILSRWRELGLIAPAPEDFSLSMEAVYAMQSLKNLKQLFWAGAYLNLLSQEATTSGVNAYYLTTPDGLKVELGRGQRTPLYDMVLKYVLGTGQQNDHDIPPARKDMEKALVQMVTDKNTNRRAFNERLQRILASPLDQFVAQSGHTERTFVDILGGTRTKDARNMTSLEKLELLFKCFILEEMA